MEYVGRGPEYLVSTWKPLCEWHNLKYMISHVRSPRPSLCSLTSEVICAEVIGMSPEGRGVPEAHVTVANEFLEAIPEPKGAEIQDLNEIAPIHTKKWVLIQLQNGYPDPW